MRPLLIACICLLNILPTLGHAAEHIPENEEEIIEKLSTLVLLYPHPYEWYVLDKKGERLYTIIHTELGSGEDAEDTFAFEGPNRKIGMGTYRRELKNLRHEWQRWPPQAKLLDDLEALLGVRPTHDLADWGTWQHVIMEYMEKHPKDAIHVTLPDKRMIGGSADEKGQPFLYYDDHGGVRHEQKLYRKEHRPLTQWGMNRAEKKREQQFSEIQELFTTVYRATVTRGMGNQPYFTGKPRLHRGK